MYVMRQTQIKGAKRSGKEADKEIGQQNIQGKRRMLVLGNTVLGKTATENEFGYGKLSNFFIDMSVKTRKYQKDGQNLSWTVEYQPVSW